MTKEEFLASVSTEDLKAELERRKKMKKEAKVTEMNKNPRCRMCKYFATVDSLGNSRSEPPKPWEPNCCPFAKSKLKRKRLLCLSGSELACENYVRKDLIK